MDLDVLGGSPLQDVLDLVEPLLVEEGLADLEPFFLLEGVGHSASDNYLRRDLHHPVYQLYLVVNLSPSQNYCYRLRRVLYYLAEVLELFLHEQTRHPHRMVHTHDRAMGPVGCPESVIDVKVSELAEPLPEIGHLIFVGNSLIALLVLDRSLLLEVEPDVFAKKDLAVAAAGNLLDRIVRYTVPHELDVFAGDLLEGGHQGLEGELGLDLAVRPA